MHLSTRMGRKSVWYRYGSHLLHWKANNVTMYILSAICSPGFCHNDGNCSVPDTSCICTSDWEGSQCRQGIYIYIYIYLFIYCTLDIFLEYFTIHYSHILNGAHWMLQCIVLNNYIFDVCWVTSEWSKMVSLFWKTSNAR